MVIQAPTRITIEVHQPGTDDGGMPVVRVIPGSPSGALAASAPHAAQAARAAQPREDVPAPAAFDPGECRCLDDEDCNADHAND